jgi:hypothetical protein
MDERIDVWKDQYKDLQTSWRQNSSDTGNYGQVLRGNVRPHDQRLDGPTLPPSLSGEGAINVYESGTGFGWYALFEATEDSVLYARTVEVFEDGPITETDWAVKP